MTMAAVAPIAWISASSSSVSVTSEAAVGVSPLGPVLKTCPSISASVAAPPAALGVAPGVASWARRQRAVHDAHDRDRERACDQNGESAPIETILLTVYTSRNTSQRHRPMPSPSSSGAAHRLCRSAFPSLLSRKSCCSVRLLALIGLGIELDGDPAVIVDLRERDRMRSKSSLPSPRGRNCPGGVVLEMDVRDAVAVDADQFGRIAASGVQVGRVWAEADRAEVEDAGDLLRASGRRCRGEDGNSASGRDSCARSATRSRSVAPRARNLVGIAGGANRAAAERRSARRQTGRQAPPRRESCAAPPRRCPGR